MRALVASGGMDLKIGQVTELEGAGGQLKAASIKGKDSVERIEKAESSVSKFDAMYAALKDKLPPDVWEYPAAPA